MSAVVAHHPFGHTGGPGGIQNIQRVGGGHRHTVMGFGFCQDVIPIQIPPFCHDGFLHGPLLDNTAIRFEIGHVDRLVKKRLVGNDACHLDTAGSGHDRFGFGIIDAHRQFIGGKSAKDH